MIGHRDYLLPDVPVAVVTADFNGDGRPDVAATAGALVVLLQAADGSFQKPVSYSAGTSPAVLADGDFNHDGFIDVAVADGNSRSLYVLLGKGDGTFQAATSPTLPDVARGLAVADVNGDGRQDVVALSTSAAGNALTVLSGRGDGTFQAGVTQMMDSGHMGSGLQLADFNRDGKWDVIFLSVGDYSSSIAVSLGNGDGAFLGPVHYSTANRTVSLAIADFNGDGVLDLVQASNVGYAAVMLGNGDGTFPLESFIPAAGRSDAIRAADFNEDGKPDLALVDSYDLRVSILTGNGDGTFQGYSTTPMDTQCCMSPWSMLAVADLNADHHVDLLLPSGVAPPGYLTILSGRGDGTFVSDLFLDLGRSDRMCAGDVNRDTKLDFAVISDNQVLTLLGNGDATFGSPLVSPLPSRVDGCTLGRFNADAKLDLVVVDNTNSTVEILLGGGNGLFGRVRTVAPLAGSLYRADFNRDGKLDLLVSAWPPSILLGNGDGIFAAPIPLDTVNQYVIAVADFNNDGLPDLLLSDFGGAPYGVDVLLGNGDGTFRGPITTTVAYGPPAVAAADFNRDGKLDLAVVYPVGSSAQPAVFLGNGDGTFGTRLRFSLPGETFSALQAADLNRDGKPDFVAVSYSHVILLLGDGQGHLGKPSVYGATGGWTTDLVVGDLNSDGKPDLAMNHASGISILLQAGPAK